MYMYTTITCYHGPIRGSSSGRGGEGVREGGGGDGVREGGGGDGGGEGG